MTIPYKYPKIETLFTRDKETFKVHPFEFRFPEFELIKEDAWQYQEKIDGTNIRIGYNGQAVEFGGRTDRAQLPTDLLAVLQDTFTLPRIKAAFGEISEGTWVTLFGEGYGSGIQKGGKYRSNKGFILFDVRVGDWWLQPEDVTGIATALDIPYAPYYPFKTLREAIVAVATGHLPSIIAQEVRQAEGLVLRTDPMLRFRNGDRLMAKIKIKDFPKET